MVFCSQLLVFGASFYVPLRPLMCNVYWVLDLRVSYTSANCQANMDLLVCVLIKLLARENGRGSFSLKRKECVRHR